MSTKHRIGLSCVLALGLAACGSNLSTDDAGTTPYPGPDAAVVPVADASVPVVDPYVWVVIQDTEQKACSTNGPGADIDAVAKMDAAGTVTGWGMIGKASFTPNPLGNACENVDCSGGNCKYAAISKTFTEAELVARTEGPVDGQVKAGTASDVGYFSLNAGTLQIQIGDAVTGAGPAQAIKAGDWIAVYEVDQTYPANGYAPAACICAPEHYTVSLQAASGKVVQLKASRLETANATSCEALTATSLEGCGTTVFAVPNPL